MADLHAVLVNVLRAAEGLTATNDRFSVTRTDGNWTVRRIFNRLKTDQAKSPMSSAVAATTQQDSNH